MLRNEERIGFDHSKAYVRMYAYALRRNTALFTKTLSYLTLLITYFDFCLFNSTNF